MSTPAFDREVFAILERVIGGADPAYTARVKGPGEHIIAACWRTPDGDYYTGSDHMAAWQRAWRDRVPGTHELDPHGIVQQDTPEGTAFWKNLYDPLNETGWKDGFLTNEHHFMTREEAMSLARRARQLDPAIHKLTKITRLDSSSLAD